MMFAEQSTIAQDITAVFAGVATLFGMFIAFKQWQLMNQSRVNAQKIDVVKVKQDAAVQVAKATKVSVAQTSAAVSKQLSEITEASAERTKLATETVSVLKEVHKNTNGAMTVALRNAAEFARKVADLTKLPADEDAASAAEQKYREHAAKQSEIGSQDWTGLRTI